MPDALIKYWEPPGEPPLFPRQKESLAACFPGNPQNLVCLSGPRWSGKTQVCHSIVAQHAWNTYMADICILVITQSVGIDSGVWQHLTETFLPDWIAQDFGMEWETEPFIHNVTKKPGCAVTNKHGNKSRISLQSLRNEQEVEERFKGKQYSMIWVNELSKFHQRKTFDTLKQCFRGMPNLTPDDYLFLADTNPCLIEGSQSWIYKLWYEFRTADSDQLKKIFPDIEPEILVPLQRCLKLIEFTVDDNLSLSPVKKAQLRADFAHNRDLLDAYYYGKWVTASEDALFFKVFRPQYHVIGDVETAADPDPEIMVPEETCFELVLGMDPGGVNCASAILEKAYEKRTKFIDDKEVIVDVPILKLLDELVIVGEDFDLWDYVEELVEKMDFWERVAGRPGRIMWNMWSDRSVFDMRVPFSERYWANYITEASGGKIQLTGVERGRGSVGQRVDLFRKILFEDRFFVNKSKCPQTIDMCKGIRRGKGLKVINPGDPRKHVFDAITYAAGQELSDELRRSSLLSTRRISNGQTSLISVSL